ncbi:P-loop NTPase [Chlamydiota bacterium]
MVPQIISICSGKGGTGKTIITANIGLALGMFSKRVTMIDLDLGKPNLAFRLGLLHPELTLDNFLRKKGREKRVDSLEDISYKAIIETQDDQDTLDTTRDKNHHNDHCKLIPGAKSIGIGDLQTGLKKRLIKNILQIPSEFILLDQSAGIHHTTIDLYLQRLYRNTTNFHNQGILITLPHDPSSIFDIAQFIECAVYRQLDRYFFNIPEIHQCILQYKDPLTSNFSSLIDLADTITAIDRFSGDIVSEIINGFTIHILFNMVTEADVPLLKAKFQGIYNYFKKLMGISINYLGSLSYSYDIVESCTLKKPFFTYFSDSQSTNNIGKIAQNLIEYNK